MANKSIRVSKIEPSNLPTEVDGKTVYKMCCVHDGKARELECTPATYQRIRDERLNMEVKHDFSLSFDDRDRVIHIGVMAKESTMKGVFTTTDEDGVDSKTLVILQDLDGKCLPDHVPETMTLTQAEKVASTLEHTEKDIIPRAVFDSMKVTEVRQREVGNAIYLRSVAA